MTQELADSDVSQDVAAAALDGTLHQDAGALERSCELSRCHDMPPVQIPGLTIVRCIGEGAFGSVWLAREQNTGKQVAVKFYTHRRGLDWSLLNREVEKLAVLYTSRHIVGLLEVGWEADPPYYIMEYLENGSLDSFLADGPLPPHEAVRIARHVLSALVHAHGSGILHCDLKPANVLLDSDFEPRLCDFGQSRLSDEQDPALGTLFYMAPEQADLKAIPDARWDVYALGALLYHLLCGEPPFRSEENERLIRSGGALEEKLAIYRRIVRNGPRPARHRKVSGVDRRLADIVDRCLHPDPHKRFPNAQAVLDSLELRERHRSRRPLIALGVIGPALLMGGMFPIARDAMQTAVATAERNLTDRALESDVVSVQILAHGMERELEDRKRQLVEISSEAELRSATSAAIGKPWPERTELAAMLHERKRRVDEERMRRGQELDTSWFLTDDRGRQIWREPYNETTLDESFAHRDYFHGLDREFSAGQAPAEVKPIDQPHISIAFRSQATGQYMVAISVPVWNVEEGRVIGVLARTMHLGHLLDEYKERIRGQGGDEINRMISLIDCRDWNLLDHPWMTPENLRNLPDDRFALLALDTLPTEERKRLKPPVVPGGAPARLDRLDRYRDPVGRLDAQSYGGEWLAAFSPVGNTGWTAVVQERREAALRPVAEMQQRLSRYAVWALGVACGLIGLLWFFVLRAINDPRLRNWSRSSGFRQPGTASGLTDR